jgi:hypothetical protein
MKAIWRHQSGRVEIVELPGQGRLQGSPVTRPWTDYLSHSTQSVHRGKHQVHRRPLWASKIYARMPSGS